MVVPDTPCPALSPLCAVAFLDASPPNFAPPLAAQTFVFQLVLLILVDVSGDIPRTWSPAEHPTIRPEPPAIGLGHPPLPPGCWILRAGLSALPQSWDAGRSPWLAASAMRSGARHHNHHPPVALPHHGR